MTKNLAKVTNGRSIKLWVRRPSRGVFIVGLLLVVASMLLTYRHAAFTSDDVMFQNALLHWRPFSGDTFFDNKDGTFILQAPLYWLVSLVMAPGRHAMLADGILLTLINFSLVYYSILYFFKVLKINVSWFSLSPVILLSAFGYGLNRLSLGSNYHTLSVGLIFVLLMLVSKLCRGELTGASNASKILIGTAIALFVGAAVVNDRYFVYFGLLPALGLTALHVSRRTVPAGRGVVIGLLLAIGYEVAIAIRHVLPHVGIVLAFGVGAPSFVDFNSVGNYAMNTLHSLCYIMGINFFGQPVAGIETLVSFLDIFILFIVMVTSVKLLRSSETQPELTMIAGLFWFAIVVYTVSSFNLGTVQTFRYLTVAPFLAVIMLAVYMSSPKLTRLKKGGAAILVALTIAVGIGANALNSVATTAAAMIGWSNSNAPNLQLISELENMGVTKGYAEYWSSHINTYLSGGRLTVQPVACDSGATVPYTAFVDKEKYVEPSARSFYIFVPKAPLCTETQVREQFGNPTRQVETEGDMVWIYNYDINTRMDLSGLRQS